MRALGKLSGIIPAQGIRRQESDAAWEASWRGWDLGGDKELEEEGTGIQVEQRGGNRCGPGRTESLAQTAGRRSWASREVGRNLPAFS